MKTFEEHLTEKIQQSKYLEIHDEVVDGLMTQNDIQKMVVKLDESMTDAPDLTPYFDANKDQIHTNVSATVSKLIMEMIEKGNNDYRDIVKILETTITLVSLLNEYDVQLLAPKFKKNIDITSKIMGMDPGEYNVLLNKELNKYRDDISAQVITLNKLLNNNITLKT